MIQSYWIVIHVEYRVATQFLFQNSLTFPIFQTQIIGPLAHFTDASTPSPNTFIAYSEKYSHDKL